MRISKSLNHPKIGGVIGRMKGVDPRLRPEKLLRALLLQVLYSIRSKRLLMEQLDYNLLFRWFETWEMVLWLGTL